MLMKALRTITISLEVFLIRCSRILVVTINKYLQPKDLSVRCQCPYNLGEICRHEVAALFQLNDILQSGFFENTNIVYDQKHTVVRMRQVTKQMMQIFTAPEALEKAERIAK